MMCTVTPLLPYLHALQRKSGQFKALLRDPKSAPASFSIGRESVPREAINMRVCDFGVYYSGHADRAGLLHYIFEMPFTTEDPPRTPVFLTHGSDEQRVPFKRAIEERMSEQRPGERAVESILLPQKAWWYDLDAKGFQQPSGDRENGENSHLLKELLREQRWTNDLLSLMGANIRNVDDISRPLLDIAGTGVPAGNRNPAASTL